MDRNIHNVIFHFKMNKNLISKTIQSPLVGRKMCTINKAYTDKNLQSCHKHDNLPDQILLQKTHTRDA